MKLKHTLILGTMAATMIAALPAQASRADERVEMAAKNTYVFKTYLRDDTIHVKAKDGVVTLTGTVADDSQKAMAADTVSSLPGVVTVNNELQVTEEMPTTHTDKWIELKVKSALLFHRNVSASTKVTARDGIVTLQGVVVNPEQKDLTTEYAKDVDGVTVVHNEMVVGGAPAVTGTPANGDYAPDRTAGDKIDDASITAEVKLALLSHHSTSALDTKVKTRNGVVYLTGVAQNAAQKDLTTKIVSDVQGVAHVTNHMRVEAPVSQ
ncbi:MAG TPA: BON domain-containing protein [Candidatus Saccharimonadales bacterium]|nr:BON domain-containing protein [Candidatus Saccharimonadales bacterium]